MAAHTLVELPDRFVIVSLEPKGFFFPVIEAALQLLNALNYANFLQQALPVLEILLTLREFNDAEKINHVSVNHQDGPLSLQTGEHGMNEAVEREISKEIFRAGIAAI